uniref:Uncharacterized protein n=1 Tax=Myoviridae sp. ctshb19 TaxID=2825194 RepID=A0A8S5UGK1_9CAUD|nr:MAG TPA: hypothetical protein [Myoviridae sp. ctshb19]
MAFKFYAGIGGSSRLLNCRAHMVGVFGAGRLRVFFAVELRHGKTLTLLDRRGGRCAAGHRLINADIKIEGSQRLQFTFRHAAFAAKGCSCAPFFARRFLHTVTIEIAHETSLRREEIRDTHFLARLTSQTNIQHQRKHLESLFFQGQRGRQFVSQFSQAGDLFVERAEACALHPIVTVEAVMLDAVIETRRARHFIFALAQAQDMWNETNWLVVFHRRRNNIHFKADTEMLVHRDIIFPVLDRAFARQYSKAGIDTVAAQFFYAGIHFGNGSRVLGVCCVVALGKFLRRNFVLFCSLQKLYAIFGGFQKFYQFGKLGLVLASPLDCRVNCRGFDFLCACHCSFLTDK